MGKEAFRQAATFFVHAVDKIGSDQWDEPALGVWTVRDLIGHTSRSIDRVAEFGSKRADKVDVISAAEHYHLSLANEGVDDAIAKAGREAGQWLGHDIQQAIRTSLDVTLKLLETIPDNTTIAYTNGGIKLEHYLETRVVELTIHTLDILTATGNRIDPPREALACTLRILADLAIDSGLGGRLALLATGRATIAERFSVLI